MGTSPAAGAAAAAGADGACRVAEQPYRIQLHQYQPSPQQMSPDSRRHRQQQLQQLLEQAAGGGQGVQQGSTAAAAAGCAATDAAAAAAAAEHRTIQVGKMYKMADSYDTKKSEEMWLQQQNQQHQAEQQQSAVTMLGPLSETPDSWHQQQQQQPTGEQPQLSPVQQQQPQQQWKPTYLVPCADEICPSDVPWGEGDRWIEPWEDEAAADTVELLLAHWTK
jgi:hypothetical protein